jgi:competence protein ComEA
VQARQLIGLSSNPVTMAAVAVTFSNIQSMEVVMRVVRVLVVVMGSVIFGLSALSGMAMAAEKKEVPQGAAVVAEKVSPSAQSATEGKAAEIKADKAMPKNVNINSADKDQLVALPGIGPKTAEAIVAYRKENGNFKSVEELTKVKGVGDKTLEKLRPYLQVI